MATDQTDFYARADNIPWKPNCAIFTTGKGVFRVVTLADMRSRRNELDESNRDLCDNMLVAAIIVTAAIRNASMEGLQ